MFVTVKKRAVTLADLVTAGLIAAGDILYYEVNTRGAVHHIGVHTVVVEADGQLLTQDGRRFTSLTAAATELGGGIRNGWDCWRLGGSSGRKLKEVRADFEQQ